MARGSEISISENLMLILISALAAYLILNFPRPKFPFGASALYPGYLIILSVAMQMINIDPSLVFSLLILSIIFYTENLINFLPETYATPLIKLVMPAIPIGIAWLFS